MPTQLSPADIITKLQTQLAAWVTAKKGLLSIAEDPWHVLELLAETPVGFRVILHWAGDRNAADDIDDGIDNHTVEVIVSKNRGLAAKRGDHLVEPRAGVALLVLVGQVKAKIKGSFALWEQEITQGEIEYRGCEPVTTPEGVPLDAYRLSWSLLAARSTDTGDE